MDDRERFRARWWLVVTILICAMLGLTPLAQALEYARIPDFAVVALVAQTVVAVLWLIVAGPLAARLPDGLSAGRALFVVMNGTAFVSFTASALLLAVVRPALPKPWLGSVLLVWLGWLPTHLLTTGLIALVATWTNSALQRQRTADKQALLNAAVVKAELEALRARLEPHFLLNALNTVAALARTGSGDRAADVAADLGELLRFALADATDHVPFDAEREIVERYLAIEQARLGERLVVRWEIAPDARQASLPALVWQPLVENAIRHGLARRSTPGMLRLIAACEAGTLRLIVDADGAESNAEAALPTQAVPFEVPAVFGGLGIGIAATRRRLDLLYGDDATLALETRPDGSRSVLTIPMRRVPAPEVV